MTCFKGSSYHPSPQTPLYIATSCVGSYLTPDHGCLPPLAWEFPESTHSFLSTSVSLAWPGAIEGLE